jgi:hypothetical protein
MTINICKSVFSILKKPIGIWPHSHQSKKNPIKIKSPICKNVII